VVAGWAGRFGWLCVDFACELGERAAMAAGGVRGYKSTVAHSGLWDLYKALPQDNVVSCKPKHNM